MGLKGCQCLCLFLSIFGLSCHTFRLSYQNFLQTAQQSFLKGGGGMLCPKLGGVAGPFSLAGILNWGGAKTGNWRVDKNRDDQGTNGD